MPIFFEDRNVYNKVIKNRVFQKVRNKNDGNDIKMVWNGVRHGHIKADSTDSGGNGSHFDAV